MDAPSAVARSVVVARLAVGDDAVGVPVAPSVKRRCPVEPTELDEAVVGARDHATAGKADHVAACCSGPSRSWAEALVHAGSGLACAGWTPVGDRTESVGVRGEAGRGEAGAARAALGLRPAGGLGARALARRPPVFGPGSAFELPRRGRVSGRRLPAAGEAPLAAAERGRSAARGRRPTRRWAWSSSAARRSSSRRAAARARVSRASVFEGRRGGRGREPCAAENCGNRAPRILTCGRNEGEPRGGLRGAAGAAHGVLAGLSLPRFIDGRAGRGAWGERGAPPPPGARSPPPPRGGGEAMRRPTTGPARRFSSRLGRHTAAPAGRARPAARPSRARRDAPAPRAADLEAARRRLARGRCSATAPSPAAGRSARLTGREAARAGGPAARRVGGRRASGRTLLGPDPGGSTGAPPRPRGRKPTGHAVRRPRRACVEDRAGPRRRPGRRSAAPSERQAPRRRRRVPKRGIAATSRPGVQVAENAREVVAGDAARSGRVS